MIQPQFSSEPEEAEVVAPSRGAVQIAEPDQPPAVAVDPQTAMIQMIERVILNPDVPFEKLERMLDMRERLEANEARKAFDKAISAAKAEIPPIVKGKRVAFESKTGGAKTDYVHETLAQIAAVVDPILGPHGLSYRYKTAQSQNGDRSLVTVTCIVSHRDGHSEDTVLTTSVDTSGNKNHIQAIGSAVTYLQRYTLKAALGLSATEIDDDGKSSGGDAETITEDQYRALRDLIEATATDEGRFLAFFKVEHLAALPLSKFGAADGMLRKKLKEKGAGNA